ncbi:MAG: hypothetical protein GTO22_05510 [Gemmatimonadales bacterium]|nr:hypothetical protein [Gemmatimonadales bacterium]
MSEGVPVGRGRELHTLSDLVHQFQHHPGGPEVDEQDLPEGSAVDFND